MTRERLQEEMIEAMGRGDREAFHQFYQETARPVHSFILSLTKNAQETEDIMQETYLSVWTRAGDYTAQGKPLAWLFTIARHLCYMRFRERRREAQIGLEELSGQEEGSICVPIEEAAGKTVLLEALDRLSCQERQVVLLHAAAGMKHREVAETLELPLSTELSRYNRAMKKLQTLLLGGERDC